MIHVQKIMHFDAVYRSPPLVGRWQHSLFFLAYMSPLRFA